MLGGASSTNSSSECRNARQPRPEITIEAPSLDSHDKHNDRSLDLNYEFGRTLREFIESSREAKNRFEHLGDPHSLLGACSRLSDSVNSSFNLRLEEVARKLETLSDDECRETLYRTLEQARSRFDYLSHEADQDLASIIAYGPHVQNYKGKFILHSSEEWQKIANELVGTNTSGRCRLKDGAIWLRDPWPDPKEVFTNLVSNGCVPAIITTFRHEHVHSRQGDWDRPLRPLRIGSIIALGTLLTVQFFDSIVLRDSHPGLWLSILGLTAGLSLIFPKFADPLLLMEVVAIVSSKREATSTEATLLSYTDSPIPSSLVKSYSHNPFDSKDSKSCKAKAAVAAIEALKALRVPDSRLNQLCKRARFDHKTQTFPLFEAEIKSEWEKLGVEYPSEKAKSLLKELLSVGALYTEYQQLQMQELAITKLLGPR